MKLLDEVKRYDKEVVFDNYSKIVADFKNYEKITKVKMIEEVKKVYSDYHNIISICTVSELKLLKLVVESNGEVVDLDRDKYSWEIDHLRHKFLLFTYPNFSVPAEFYDNVCLALKKVKWNEAKENDRRNELLVGVCKVYGEISTNNLITLGSAFLGISSDDIIDHIVHNKLFQYFVYYTTRVNSSLDMEFDVFVYQDYFSLLDDLIEERKRQGVAFSKEINIDDYINIFYYDFNINRKVVRTFYKKLISLCPYYTLLIDEIKIYSLLNLSRDSLKLAINNFLNLEGKEYDKFYQLLDEAMDEMPSAVLNGATPNDVKYLKLEQTRNNYEKEVNYVQQRNAKLSKGEVKAFYKIYFALLEFTNNKYQVNSKIKKIYKQNGINPQDIIEIIEKFWNDKSVIIDEFVKKNPYHFNKEELDLVKGFEKGFHDICVIANYTEEYTEVLNGDKIYMIKGLHGNIDEIISYQSLPVMAKTSILAFGDKITYDGVFQSANVNFGVGLERAVKNDLKNNQRVFRM